MENKFYITTAIPYPNGQPHLGFALEIIQADVIARFHRQLGEKVFFLTGTDEHGQKVYQTAQKEGLDFQEYVDKNSTEFQNLKEVLNISYNDFIRTTDRIRHWPGAEKLWQECAKDIYLKEYSGLYCVGHEAFVTERDLENGICLEHGAKPEKVTEKNYFFKLAKYKEQIHQLIESNQLLILPESRKNEVLNLLKDSEDFSVSRPKEKISWGIPVPNNPDQTIYVWFDALANYITGVGYGRDEQNFNTWWPADVHAIGKGVLRFHAIYWPAMLSSAGLSLPKSLLVHGYLNIEGQKISKSLGNVISPKTVVEKYGVDPVRYFLLREVPSTEDGDFSEKKLEDRYNGDLANNLGNLVSRVAKLIETKVDGTLHRESQHINSEVSGKIVEAEKNVSQFITDFKLHEALAEIFKLFSFANEYINERAPWSESHGNDLNETLINLGEILVHGTHLLWPFLPETSEKISKILGQDSVAKSWNRINVINSIPLFPRRK